MQTDNVSNQREHLILLLANIHIRKNPKTDEHSKVFLSVYIQTPRLNMFFLVFLMLLQHWTFTPGDMPFLFSVRSDVSQLLLQLDDNALNDVMKKLFKNYKKWCKYLGRKSSLW